MKGFSFIAMVVACFLGRNSCSGRVALDPFPFGTIGCLVSDVCGSGEVCTNDLLFGSCQNIFTRALIGDIKFHLEEGEITRLEKGIKKLIRKGFTWKDAYTQCTLQNTLLEFSRGRLFNPRKCADALGVSSTDYTEDMNEEIANVLLKLLASGELDLDALEKMATEEDQRGETDLVNSNKRDEIVQVHKYFDKSTGQLKRDPFYYRDRSSDFLYMPSSGDDDEDSTLEDRLASYYAETRPEESIDEDTKFPIFRTDDESESRGFLADQPTLQEELGLEDTNMKNALTTEPEDDIESNEAPDNSQVSEDDEKKLEQLLDGSIQPEDLSQDEQERMQVFIEKLINVLEETSGIPQEETEEQLAEDLGMPSTESTNPPLNEEKENQPMNEKNENQPMNGENGEEEDENASTEEVEQEVDKKSLHVLVPPKQKGEQEETALGRVEDGDTNNDPESNRKIDSHSMYLLLSKDIDTPTAVMFIHNLTEVLRLPPWTFGFIEAGSNNLINLDVNIDPDGKWDAETIGREALKAKDGLEKMTGIYVVKAGIGRDGNALEFKQNNRYVVLTFILVGSIAGVMLAVVTIYLIKRHTRSKQKLAQLASNPDGTEVSKDYQDLCRQRMQGKTSEKPEPLHAASRIGSASESQVRSPSSRSSTSSWSEEPAATNMDISTGHIVLSYMEDHLKNQNRLDKEWEAVSSYVADPSSTKVATDQSNMRKNRYADILPYDHSRVVLSSNANVANSDYINASFITDHDPRNPAYICTQGPLPHTVADFWQMIWEQGSVVIVMLSKLAENGTSLCHRYWPEEGSDLYHIYEVHLVSEHIWCDDYLVRSFYLKNLQTNETRTVTQFHFLTWPQLLVPASIKTLLDFRRKVNKSFRGRSCPIVVHCSDGCGRSGTYCLIDMVLNKMAKGAKEIDMAATLEHIRDQRMSTVKTKEQFQFSLAAVAEEVHAILKALPQ